MCDESRGMLIDRVMGMARTQMFAPRYYRRFPGPIRFVSHAGDSVRIRQNLLVVQTLIDRQTEIVLSAVCHDVLVADAGQPRLLRKSQIVVFDSEMIPNSFIFLAAETMMPSCTRSNWCPSESEAGTQRRRSAFRPLEAVGTADVYFRACGEMTCRA